MNVHLNLKIFACCIKHNLLRNNNDQTSWLAIRQLYHEKKKIHFWCLFACLYIHDLDRRINVSIICVNFLHPINMELGCLLPEKETNITQFQSIWFIILPFLHVHYRIIIILLLESKRIILYLNFQQIFHYSYGEKNNIEYIFLFRSLAHNIYVTVCCIELWEKKYL